MNDLYFCDQYDQISNHSVFHFFKLFHVFTDLIHVGTFSTCCALYSFYSKCVSTQSMHMKIWASCSPQLVIFYVSFLLFNTVSFWKPWRDWKGNYNLSSWKTDKESSGSISTATCCPHFTLGVWETWSPLKFGGCWKENCKCTADGFQNIWSREELQHWTEEGD